MVNSEKLNGKWLSLRSTKWFNFGMYTNCSSQTWLKSGQLNCGILRYIVLYTRLIGIT